MAISFVDGATGFAPNGNAVTVLLSDITGLQTGDLIIAAAGCGDIDSTDHDIALTTSGYTEVADLNSGGAANFANLGVFYKFYDGVDTNCVMTAVGGTNAANGLVLMAFRGVKAVADGGPFDVAATTAVTSAGNPDPPSIDHSGASSIAIVIAGASAEVGGGSYTYPTNYITNAHTVTQADSMDITVGIGYRLSGYSDPEDPGAISYGGATPGSCAVTMALAEAVVTVTGVVLTVTPSLPTGSIPRSMTGVVLTVTPSLPAGKLNHGLAGVVLSVTPSLPVGEVTKPPVLLTGVVLTLVPTLPVGEAHPFRVGGGVEGFEVAGGSMGYGTNRKRLKFATGQGRSR